MEYENFTIRQFEKAWLNKDYSEIPKDKFETVYYEYVDTTLAYISSHFDKVVYIRLLENRINVVSKFCHIQQLFFEEFNQPYIDKLQMLKDYGYVIKWTGDKKHFFDQLSSIKSEESSTESDLQISIKELEDLRKEEPNRPDQTEKDKRENWMVTINSLVKLGYTIDKDKMTVEELSYIIKYEKEKSFKDGR